MVRSQRNRSVGGAPTVCLLFPLLLAVGCNGAKTPDGGHFPVGSVQLDGGTWFFVEDNDAGLSPEPRLVRLAWGRLVDVYGLTYQNQRTLMLRDFVVDPDLVGDGYAYDLAANPLTGAQELTILRDVEDTGSGGGRDQFFALLRQAEETLHPVIDAGLHESGAFTMVPRNAALTLQFDDLIDPGTLDATTVRLLAGVPTVLPFEARIFADPHHGDVAACDSEPGREYYPTRIVVDTTVTELEAFGQDPPLAVNTIGLPGSVDTNHSNVQVRVPTRVHAAGGQSHVLTNPSGHALSSEDAGTVDYDSGSLDLTRLARSGGDAAWTNDPYRGFLRDDDPPRIIGQQSVELLEAPVPLGEDADRFLLPTVVFASEACAQAPRPGDVLEQAGLVAEVTAEGQPPVAGVVSDLEVRLVVWPRAWDELGGAREWEAAGAGPARYLTPFDAQSHAGREACFLTFFPSATGYPDEPASGVFPSSIVTVRFSEPLDAEALGAFDALSVTRVPEPTRGHEWIVGSIATTPARDEFTFVPARPLSHREGASEAYWLRIGTGPLGPVDLAGNGVRDPFVGVRFELEPGAPAQATGGRATRFSSADEEPPIADPDADPPQLEALAEWNGQVSFDLARQSLLPRSVTRFEGVVDRNQVMVGTMQPNPFGNQVPLSNFGAKAQTVWRHEDMGLPLVDDSSYNLDLEGLNWAPLGGQAVVDTFDAFEIRVSHSSRYPDELGTGASGLLKSFDQNQLHLTHDPQRVLHSRELGYRVDPGKVYAAPSGTKLMPFPFNEGAADERVYWTWRDTSIHDRAGEDGLGVPSIKWQAVTAGQLTYVVDCNGNCPADNGYLPTLGAFYDAGELQSVGLPLLLEFRTWPDVGALGTNRFETSFPTLPGTPPWFLAFSAGGIDTTLQKVLIDPDFETVANGGFNPNSLPNPGEKTSGLINLYTLGSADLVVRVSRSTSVWFPVVDGEGQAFSGAKPRDVVMEPAASQQPAGTSVTASFRAALDIAPPEDDAYDDIRANARRMDLFGDHYPTFEAACVPPVPPDNHNRIGRCSGLPQVNVPIAFLHDSDGWTDDVTTLEGALYYQVRLTFVSNAQTGLSPELASFGVTWTE